MTKKQRDAVVELLRCAADWDEDDEDGCHIVGLWQASMFAGISLGEPVEVLADLAYKNVADGEHDFEQEAWRHHLLEAAQRVEDCEWP